MKVFTLQIVKEHEAPAVLPVDVKYVQFSATVPAPQVFSKTQHTPKEEAQEPLELPLNFQGFKI